MSDKDKSITSAPEGAPGFSLADLKVLNPLASLLPVHLEALAAEAQQHWLFAGDVLFQQGQCDPWVYFLVYGSVEYRYQDGSQSAIDAYEILMPLANEQPRLCTLVATGDCLVVALDRQRLDQLLTWSHVAEYLLADIAANPDFDEDANWMSTILRSNLFLKVPPTNMDKLFQYIKSQTVYNQEVIIRQGEYGDCCYFIKEGTAVVTRRSGDREAPQKLADIGDGRCFGEDALVYETVRNATVTMTSDGVLMVLDKDRFLELLRSPKVPCLHWRQWQQVSREMVVIDVRTEPEYREGHLGGAINIPLNLLSLKRRVLPQGNTLAIYCDTGRRSQVAAGLLLDQGCTAVYLKEGLNALSPDDRTAQVTQQDYLISAGKVVKGLSSPG